MKLSYFKPSEFTFEFKQGISFIEQFCDQANAKLEREAVKVYLDKEDNGWHCHENTNSGKTHTAFLINIQPIKECEHKEVNKNHKHVGGYYCANPDCNKQLEPTGWRVKNG